MTAHVRVGGVFKDVNEVYTRVGGVWKSVEEGYTRVGGIWKKWFEPAGSFELIQSTILGSTATTITFSSIPQTYKHLQVRLVVRSSVTGSGNTPLDFRFNGDTGANYNHHRLGGAPTTSVFSSAFTSQTTLRFLGLVPRSGNNAAEYGTAIIDISDYSVTSKFTTVKAWSNFTSSESNLVSGAYRNTNAVTSIQFIPNTGFTAGTRISVYGIKG